MDTAESTEACDSPMNGGSLDNAAAAAIDDDDSGGQFKKENNTLAVWGNKTTMNLNHLVLENIVQSPYYRNNLSGMKTFHELIDEIYYNVAHLEPWEKGTRKTTGQTGMCGGVRGVGAGGVVSTPFCIMYRLFTLRLTRKQVYSMLNHTDSPYIRGLGFMYIRFCLQPSTFWEWYEPYLEDEEQIDPRAGGGDPITIGQMVKMFLTKLEWYSTLFPRIPVPVQKDLDVKMREHNKKIYATQVENQKVAEYIENAKRSKSPETTKDDRSKSREKIHKEEKSGENRRSRSRNDRKRSRSRSPHRKRSRSPSSHRKRSKEDDHRLSKNKHSKRSSRSRSKSKKRDVKNNEEKKSSRHKHSSHKGDRDRDCRHNHEDRHRHSKSKKKSRSSSSRSKDKSSKKSKDNRKRHCSVSSDTEKNLSKIHEEKRDKEDGTSKEALTDEKPDAVDSELPLENQSDDTTRKSDVIPHQSQTSGTLIAFDEEEGELKDESFDEKNGSS